MSRKSNSMKNGNRARLPDAGLAEGISVEEPSPVLAVGTIGSGKTAMFSRPG